MYLQVFQFTRFLYIRTQTHNTTQRGKRSKSKKQIYARLLHLQRKTKCKVENGVFVKIIHCKSFVARLTAIPPNSESDAIKKTRIACEHAELTLRVLAVHTIQLQSYSHRLGQKRLHSRGFKLVHGVEQLRVLHANVLLNSNIALCGMSKNKKNEAGLIKRFASVPWVRVVATMIVYREHNPSDKIKGDG